jgi:hypothetical protein
MSRAGDLLESLGLPADDLHARPSSTKRFPDGGEFRIEIPSTEGPDSLDAVIATAAQLEVPIHRVSQGSGVFMLTDLELDHMARSAADSRMEVSLFARPGALWGVSAMVRSSGGATAGASAYGQQQVAACVEDILRAADHGYRSVLIADLGVLAVFGRMRQQGMLPADMQAKVSVMLPAANPGAAQVLAGLGASTLNVPTDMTISTMAAVRSVIDIPLDVYIESPDNLGGFVRMHEIAEIIRVAAPVYLKFGLRNAPDVYPSGSHLEAVARSLSRERVRRARLGLELLARSGPMPTMSPLGASDLAIPSRPMID